MPVSPPSVVSPSAYRVQSIRWILCALLLGLSITHTVYAQENPVVEPRTKEARVQIERGRDIVQPPSLWYQKGHYVDPSAYPDSVIWNAPDSLGVLRIPCCDSGGPDAITYPDAEGRFPVNLQVATFVRDGQIAELPIGDKVIEGTRPAQIVIRTPPEDFYDIAIPFGADTIKQVPGDETIIDARTWYQNSLRNRTTGQVAPADSFNTVRELRGQLRSTAPGGEGVFFVIVARQSVSPPSPPDEPPFFLAPIDQTLPLIESPRIVIDDRPRPSSPNLDWKTTTALMAGPNRADIPGRSISSYAATRIKGDIRSTLRLWANPTASYLLSVFGSSQATFSNDGNHHDVPYGLAVAARFGASNAVELRAEASQEDDPFQLQGFDAGDQRLRFLVGYDHMSATNQFRMSMGPTYYRDQQSSWESGRSDARQLGVSIEGVWEKRLRLGLIPVQFASSALLNQSWGYIQDAGNRNTTIAGRLAIKPQIRILSTEIGFGPVAYLQYVDNEYAAIQGFSEFNAQFGLEVTSHLLF